MLNEEAAEREAREIERSMCKVKVYCQHPKTNSLVERKLRIHKNVSLKDATKCAYEVSNLILLSMYVYNSNHVDIYHCLE